MGTCHSSKSRVRGAVMPVGQNNIVVPGCGPAPGGQVAPAPDYHGSKLPTSVSDGHSITDSGLYYSESKNSADNLVAESKKGNVDTVANLLRNGADVNMKGMWGNTPLIAACQYGHADVCRVLLDCSGIDVNVRNEKGAAAILYASMEGLEDACSKMLTLGAEISADHAIIYNSKTDKSGPYSAVSAAVSNGHVGVLQRLAAAGTDMAADIIDPLQRPASAVPLTFTKPMMLACACNQPDVIRFLVGLGISVTGTDSSKGYTVLHHACKTRAGAAALIPLLLSLASLSCDADKESCIINSQSITGDTPLILAAEVACESAVALLVEAGAMPNASNCAGVTPLHVAARKRSENIVRLLLAANADPRIVNAEGVCPLDIVNKYNDNSAIKIMILDAVAHSRVTNIGALGDSDNIDYVEGTLPLVPSRAVFITRDMLAGNPSSSDLMNEVDPHRAGHQMNTSIILENNLELDFSSQMLTAEVTVTPQKGDSSRDPVVTAPRAILTAAGSYGNSKSSDAPLKAPSSMLRDVGIGANQTHASLDAMKIRPKDLFGVD